ncbi:MAG: 4Fe-4S binding protein [bacterium]
MHEIDVSKGVLVLGGGTVGTRISLSLSSIGLEVFWLGNNPYGSQAKYRDGPNSEHKDGTKQKENLRSIPSGKLVDLKGQVGNFEALIMREGKETRLKIGAIVVAEEPVQRFIRDDFGIDLSDRIMTQSQLQKRFNPKAKKRADILKIAGKIPERICFVLGHASQEGRVPTAQCLEHALMLRERIGSEVYVLCNDLKVAGNGTERWYGKARDAGVIFLKYKCMPEFDLNNGKIHISIEEKHLNNKKIFLSSDLLVLDEKIAPYETFQEISAILKVSRDEKGFFQEENIHLYPVHSNRRGIFFLGNCHSDLDHEDILTETRVITGNIRELLSGGRMVVEEKVSIEPSKCALCLTCVRSCPHKAIEPGIDEDSDKKCAKVFHEACFGCGICAAFCPAKAIKLIQEEQ